VSYGYALLVAAGLGYFLLRVPIQVTDCFSNMLALDEPFGVLMRRILEDRSYLRPGLWAALKAVYDLAGGEYFYWFRVTHVVQGFLVIILFVRLADPRSLAEAAALPLGLAALIGGHTFAWTVREAFPINTFLTIVVCCAAAANLAFARHRWWTDGLAALLFAFAVLTVESGVLVWVIFACAQVVGLRGVSRRGVIVLTVMLAGYFVVRASFGVGVPDLVQREAGFGFTRRSGQELQAMFGANPLPFYAYNVAASFLGVLFAEPRDGVWRLTRAAVQGARDLPAIVNVLSSTIATGVICWFAWHRRAAWQSGQLNRRDRIVLLFGAVLIANAAIGYAYTKDVIMSAAGFFFAAALLAAASELFESLAQRRWRTAAAGWAIVAVLSSAWAVRLVGVHAALAATAVNVREQWANVDDWIARQIGPLDARGVRLKHRLQDDAVVRFPVRPPLRDKWILLFDVE
jgi:hypothetical protein